MHPSASDRTRLLQNPSRSDQSHAIASTSTPDHAFASRLSFFTGKGGVGKSTALLLLPAPAEEDRARATRASEAVLLAEVRKEARDLRAATDAADLRLVHEAVDLAEPRAGRARLEAAQRDVDAARELPDLQVSR